MPTTTQNPHLSGGRISASDPARDGEHYTSGAYTPEIHARGFIPDADGTLSIDFVGTGAEGRTPATNVPITVKAGIPYPLVYKKIYAGSPAGTILY